MDQQGHNKNHHLSEMIRTALADAIPIPQQQAQSLPSIVVHGDRNVITLGTANFDHRALERARHL